MATLNDVPRVAEPIAGLGGFVTRAWLDFFLKLASSESQADLAALYAALAARVAELEENDGFSFQIIGQGAVSVNGTPQPGGFVVISLDNDVDNPGNTMYYGTGPTGERGWFPVSGTMLVEAGQLTKTVSPNGVTTFGLADVANSGAGVLLATTFDSKGRRTGSRAATITGTTNQINVSNGDAAAGLPTLSLAPAVITSLGKADTALQPGADHNNQLSGLQGGTLGQYYHLTAAQSASAATISTSGHINGLGMLWDSATSVSFYSGTVAIQSLGSLLTFPSMITKAGLVLSASTFYHCYAYSNAGTPDIEIVTTAPAAPYNGTARSKAGDTSRRYVGSILTNSTSQILNFKHIAQPGTVLYRNRQDLAPFRPLAAGSAIVETPVSLAGCIPLTAAAAQVRLFNNNTSVATFFSTSDDSAAGPPSSGIAAVPGGGNAYIPFPVDSAQAITYWNQTAPTAGQGAFVDVYGYYFER